MLIHGGDIVKKILGILLPRFPCLTARVAGKPSALNTAGGTGLTCRLASA
jgi:hypothetical protein